MKKRLLLLTGLALLLLTNSCSLRNKVAQAYTRNVKHGPFDAIIVPGYPYLPNDTSRNETLFRMRINWAKALYDRGVAHNIIFSGAAVHSAYEEGKLMKLVAEKMGVPAAHIYVEDKALHSTTNLLYGRRLAKKLGFKKIAIATDPYQFAYLPVFRWYLAPGVRIIPFSMDSLKDYSRALPAFDPSSTMIKDFVPLERR